MWPTLVIVGQVLTHDPSQMLLTHDDHMIETFSANAADQPLDVWVAAKVIVLR